MYFLEHLLPAQTFPNADYADAYREAHGPGWAESFAYIFSFVFACICGSLLKKGYMSFKYDYAELQAQSNACKSSGTSTQMNMYPFPKDESLESALNSEEFLTVVFRSWRKDMNLEKPGQIIALFPFIPASAAHPECDCMCYEWDKHFHSAAYQSVIDRTRAIDMDDDDDNEAENNLLEEISKRGFHLSTFTHGEIMQEIGFRAGQSDSASPLHDLKK